MLETIDHVKTPLPYVLTGAVAYLVVGFIAA